MPTVWQRGWVIVRGGKGEHGGFGGGLRPTQRGCRQPKSGRQTCTRKGRLRQTGRVRQPKRHCLLCLLNDNNYNSGLREGSVITTALRRNGPLGLWSRPQRGQGEGKGAEGQSPFRYLGESEPGRRRLETCLLSAFGYGAEGPQEWWAKPHTLPSVRLTLTAAKKQRPHKETKCKQAGKASC